MVPPVGWGTGGTPRSGAPGPARYTFAVEHDVRSHAQPAHGDPLVDELRMLRASRGVSYRELAARITRQREADGVAPATARIAHTTVSDVFRPGRSRLNAELVAEIVRALGGDEETAEEWRTRVARRVADVGARPVDALAPVAPALPVLPAPEALPAATNRPASAFAMTALVVGGLLLNATGRFFNPLLGDILFVDMVGTATVALLGGPWLAALVGVLFVAVELLKLEFGGALFGVTMISAGLIWGYGARRGWGRTLPRFLALSAVVAVATSAVAVPITMLYFDGQVGRGLDVFYAWMQGAGLGPWFAVGGVNLAISLLDKILTGAIAFALARLIWTIPGIPRTSPR